MSENVAPESLTGRFEILPMDCVLFGPGSIESLKAECERLKMDRVLVVLSPSLAKTTDIEATLQRLLGDRVIKTFLGSQAHVPDHVLLEAVTEAREMGINGIVSVGGGSPTDLAKVINLCLVEGVSTIEELRKYALEFTYPDKFVFPPFSDKPGLPQIAIATTLSVGEFTHIGGCTDTAEKVKRAYIDKKLTPRVVIHDPELCAKTPRHLWAETGMRAVDHAVESLCSADAMPITNALSAEGLRRLVKYLPISAADPDDYHAASQCLMGGWMAISGLTNVSLGLSHGIGHQLGARCGVPHGVTSCVMLPTVLEFNYEYTQDKQAEISAIFAQEMGTSPDTAGGAAPIVRQFIESLGLPTTLSEVGVTREDFPGLAHDALNDFIVATNPKPIGSVDDVLGVLEKAF